MLNSKIDVTKLYLHAKGLQIEIDILEGKTIECCKLVLYGKQWFPGIF